LKLDYAEKLLSLASNFILRRYTMAAAAVVVSADLYAEREAGGGAC
jgi:hypothetical protein